MKMIDIKDRKLLGIFCACQLVILGLLMIVQHFIGLGFCLDNPKCINRSVKICLTNSYISIIVGWLASGGLTDGSTVISKKKKVFSLIKAAMIAFCGNFIFHFIAILYGAPLIKDFEETYTFSCLVSSMALFPLMLVTDGRWTTVFQILEFQLYKTGKIVDSVRLISFMAMAGALIGSFAIPLDWDRPWQAWPVPCCLGSIVGYTIGLLIFTLLPLVEHIKLRRERRKTKYY